MKLRQFFEQAPAKKIVAVMPGGFHPFHPGHKSLYVWAVETFGKENVYVAATDDTKSRPFPFDVKQKLAAMAGVPTQRFMQVKSPFNALSYKDIIKNPENTALVFVRSEKDKTSHPLPDQIRKSDGMMGYLISYKDGDLETADTHGYIAYGPTINFDFSGMSIKSASELRAAWPEMSDEDKLQAAELMYPSNAQEATQLLNQALGNAETSVGEDASEDEEDEFHRKLDKLVHKTFGHSSDEKKKMKESDVVIDPVRLRQYLRMLIDDAIDKEKDISKLSKVLKILVGKEIRSRGKRYAITSEDILEACKYGSYYCSTDKKEKCRQGPKQVREDTDEELPDGSTKTTKADGSYTISGAKGKEFFDKNGKLIKTITPLVNGLSITKFADGRERFDYRAGGGHIMGPMQGGKPGEPDYIAYAFNGARFEFDSRKGRPVIRGTIEIGRLKVALTGKVLDRPAFQKNPSQMMKDILGGDPIDVLKDPMAAKPMVEKGTAKLYLDGKEISPEQLAQAVEQGL